MSRTLQHHDKASDEYRRMLKHGRRATVYVFDYKDWSFKPVVTLFGVRAGERENSNRGSMFRLVGADPDFQDTDGDGMYRSYLEMDVTNRLIFDHGTISWDGWSEEGLRIRQTADEWEDTLQPIHRIPAGFGLRYRVNVYSPVDFD